MEETSTPITKPMPDPRKQDTVAWILYDVANTVYAAAITFLLMPYVTKLGEFETFSYLQTISMVLSGLAVPLMAAVADRTGKAATYLNIFTIMAVGAMVLFGVGAPIWVFMGAFMVANFCYNSALVFYNALLPSVSTPKREGLVSGLGVGLGYIGTLMTLALIFALQDNIGESMTFLVLAGTFIFIALPAMFLLHDRREIERARFSKALVGEQFGTLMQTLKSLKHNIHLRRFLIANFLCVDVINTAIVVLIVYTLAVFAGQEISLFGMDFDMRLFVTPETSTIRMPGTVGLQTVLGAGLNILALAAGVSLGFLADKWGALKAMRAAALCLMFALALGAFFSGDAWSVQGRKTLQAQSKAYDDAKKPDFAMANAKGASNPPAQTIEEAELIWSEFAIAESASVEREMIEDESATKHETFIVAKPKSGNATLFAIAIVFLGAFGLAGVWTAGRKVLLELAPREQVGEYFGLYGITVKISVFGTTIFGFLMARVSPQWALLSLLGLLIPGIILLFTVKMPAQREGSDES